MKAGGRGQSKVHPPAGFFVMQRRQTGSPGWQSDRSAAMIAEADHCQCPRLASGGGAGGTGAHQGVEASDRFGGRIRAAVTRFAQAVILSPSRRFRSSCITAHPS